MGDQHDRDNNQGAEAPHGSSLPTRTIYTAVVSVVAANIIAGLTLLVRNPMDEIDQLEAKLDLHIEQCREKHNKIMQDHIGFEWQIKQNHRD